MKVKQVIVMRTDLNMRKGKIAAQAAHASMKVFFDRGSVNASDNSLTIRGLGSDEIEWIDGLFTKVCVGIGSEIEMIDIYNRVKQSGIPCSLITDSGLTEFHGVPTNTCIAVGPADEAKVNEFTGHLKLL